LETDLTTKTICLIRNVYQMFFSFVFYWFLSLSWLHSRYRY